LDSELAVCLAFWRQLKQTNFRHCWWVLRTLGIFENPKKDKRHYFANLTIQVSLKCGVPPADFVPEMPQNGSNSNFKCKLSAGTIPVFDSATIIFLEILGLTYPNLILNRVRFLIAK
jgi:hypothetical protein